MPDAVIVGGGPNGLAAAITLARAGLGVEVLEANDTVGGGARTLDLTGRGSFHDLCAAVVPLARASPFFNSLPGLRDRVTFLEPEVQLAHPLESGGAFVVRSYTDTATGLGQDAAAYRRIVRGAVESEPKLSTVLLGSQRVPRHPLVLARFLISGGRPAASVARQLETDAGRALLAGTAAHSMLPLDRAPSAGIAIYLLSLAHSQAWVVPKGGAGSITAALVAELETLGGRITTGVRVSSVDELPEARVKLFDLTPRQIVSVAGSRLHPRRRRALERFRYGPGVWKLDHLLSEPVPFTDPRCRAAGTVHLGGTFEQIARAEQEVADGKIPDAPFVICAQPSVVDDSRTSRPGHVLWSYCHVPAGSEVDMTERIEAQIERFAPGFRDTIVARSSHGPMEMESLNANHVGGDINGGVQDLRQHLARPQARWDPYALGGGLFICSSSSPPGGGVHGMCGYHAARSALKHLGMRP
jgi:phytoene dehydrogenase-like protein